MSQKLKVLVTEDNEVNQKVIKVILERNGVEYEIAENGEEAIEKFKSGQFNLVLMDCQMPKMDGLQASRIIRKTESEQNSGRCPIIAMTANAMKGDMDRCMDAGMDDFLAKPFKSGDLMTVLKTWSESKGSLQ